jgi:plastocyanin
MLAKSKGFAALVSYTDNGFEPAAVTINAGEAVRFINNSSGELLWVASTSTTAAYPGTSECGGSSFDTCKALKKGEFWEFTFDEAGTWHYRNNSDISKTGTVLAR